MAHAQELDAIIVADDPKASVRIAGLSVRERALRVARRVGATHIEVIDSAAQRAELSAWRAGRTTPLLVIRADQLVHTPLVAPLVEAMRAGTGDRLLVAAGPDQAYAGALLAVGEVAAEVIAELTRGGDTNAFVAGHASTPIQHGEVACHAVGTAEERAGAHQLLYRLLIKSQDNAISRYVFRPVSRRLTRLLVHTPITPNMLSLTVGLMVAVACVLTATADMHLVILGAAIQASSGYIDCCDGEIARLKLMSSRLGAWLDTIVDEFSTLAYMTAIGWHCHLVWGHPGFDLWLAGVVVGLVTYGCTIYCIYYNIIVAVGSANSQDYVGTFEIVPAERPNTVRLRPVVKEEVPRKPLPPVIEQIVAFSPNFVRRDFIVWCALLFAVLHVTHVSFIVQVMGGVLSSSIVLKDHVHLRRLRRAVARAGQTLLLPAG